MRAFLISVITILVTTASLHAQQRDLNLSSNSPEIRDLVYDGIDVSSYQEDIDWSATASDKNIKFVYVKATEGTSYKSRHYQYNIENARKHGLRVGSYHFYRPNIPVIKQFQNFTSIVKLDEQDLVPLIDIETKGGLTSTTATCAAAWRATSSSLPATPSIRHAWPTPPGRCGNSPSAAA